MTITVDTSTIKARVGTASQVIPIASTTSNSIGRILESFLNNQQVITELQTLRIGPTAKIIIQEDGSVQIKDGAVLKGVLHQKLSQASEIFSRIHPPQPIVQPQAPQQAPIPPPAPSYPQPPMMPPTMAAPTYPQGYGQPPVMCPPPPYNMQPPYGQTPYYYPQQPMMQAPPVIQQPMTVEADIQHTPPQQPRVPPARPTRDQEIEVPLRPAAAPLSNEAQHRLTTYSLRDQIQQLKEEVQKLGKSSWIHWGSSWMYWGLGCDSSSNTQKSEDTASLRDFKQTEITILEALLEAHIQRRDTRAIVECLEIWKQQEAAFITIKSQIEPLYQSLASINHQLHTAIQNKLLLEDPYAQKEIDELKTQKQRLQTQLHPLEDQFKALSESAKRAKETILKHLINEKDCLNHVISAREHFESSMQATQARYQRSRESIQNLSQPRSASRQASFLQRPTRSSQQPPVHTNAQPGIPSHQTMRAPPQESFDSSSNTTVHNPPLMVSFPAPPTQPSHVQDLLNSRHQRSASHNNPTDSVKKNSPSSSSI